jgi:ribosome-associated translation inhibitor RaiA
MATQARAQHSTDVTSGLVLHTAGPVPGKARDQVRKLVNQLIEMAPHPISHAKVKIKSDKNRDTAERTLAQASLEVSGVTIRAESAGEDTSDALRSLVTSLENKLNHLDDPGAASPPPIAPISSRSNPISVSSPDTRPSLIRIR